MAYISVTWIHSGLFVVLLFFFSKNKEEERNRQTHSNDLLPQ